VIFYSTKKNFLKGYIKLMKEEIGVYYVYFHLPKR